MHYRKEMIRDWRNGAFRLKLWDTFEVVGGNRRLAYKLYHEGRLIFQGEDFYCSPCHAIDSDRCAASLLAFLSLRPGDTDREYFSEYTEAQMAFAMSEGERLGLIALEIEESANNEEGG